MRKRIVKYILLLLEKIDGNMVAGLRSAINDSEKTIEKSVIITKKDLKKYKKEHGLNSMRKAQAEMEKKAQDFILNKLVEDAIKKDIIEVSASKGIIGNIKVKGKLHYKPYKQ